jgi:DNA (cytosine-5)-methyltransferase 1
MAQGMTRVMTFGSLFAGIGGFDLGLERAGLMCKWQVEIDPFCRRVLEKHWPDVPRHEDVRDVGAHNLERVDLICRGFPCQDISHAGNGAGLQGEHSGLWSECRRIIREIRPGIVLVENVPELLARGMGDVVWDLADAGYDTEWACIPSAAFGSPDLRARIWILAYASSVGDGLSFRSIFSRRIGPEYCDWWASEPEICRVDDGIPGRVDRLRALGNAVKPQIAEWIGRRLMEAA